MFTYYDVLGVDPKASHNQIRKAYKQRVKRVHPDVIHDDRALRKVKLLNRAYAVLKQSDRRADYDNSLAAISGSYNCKVEVSAPHDFRWVKMVSIWLIAVAVTWILSSAESSGLLNLIHN